MRRRHLDAVEAAYAASAAPARSRRRSPPARRLAPLSAPSGSERSALRTAQARAHEEPTRSARARRGTAGRRGASRAAALAATSSSRRRRREGSHRSCARWETGSVDRGGLQHDEPDASRAGASWYATKSSVGRCSWTSVVWCAVETIRFGSSTGPIARGLPSLENTLERLALRLRQRARAPELAVTRTTSTASASAESSPSRPDLLAERDARVADAGACG